jgi:hypothetical protein
VRHTAEVHLTLTLTLGIHALGVRHKHEVYLTLALTLTLTLGIHDLGVRHTAELAQHHHRAIGSQPVRMRTQPAARDPHPAAAAAAAATAAAAAAAAAPLTAAAGRGRGGRAGAVLMLKAPGR